MRVWAEKAGYQFPFESCVETTVGELRPSYEQWSTRTGAGIESTLLEVRQDAVVYLCGVIAHDTSEGVVTVPGQGEVSPLLGISFWTSFDKYPGGFFDDGPG